MSEKEILCGADIRLLTEIGFLGVANGQYEAAGCIFTALALLRPQRDFPWIGQALCLYGEGRIEEGIVLLSNRTLENPEDDGNRLAFLGLLLRLNREGGRADHVLRQASEGAGVARVLAKVLLLPEGQGLGEKAVPAATGVLV